MSDCFRFGFDVSCCLNCSSLLEDDLYRMRDSVGNGEFPEGHPIYAVNVYGMDLIVGIDELQNRGIDICDLCNLVCSYDFDEDQILVVVNAFDRDVGGAPNSVGEIDNYLYELVG